MVFCNGTARQLNRTNLFNWGSLELFKFHDALECVRTLKPENPVICNRPHAAQRAARFFVQNFPGTSLYAVKANPDPTLLRILWDSGITHYDVASIHEVRLVAETLPKATLCYMNPVKAEANIAEAYHQHGVRIFSLDSMDELQKIARATNNADDLTLCVRLQVASEFAEISLAAKFGVSMDNSVELLMAARQLADSLGICFHVGSQAMTPLAYVHALERVRTAIVNSAVTVDIIDVGGGFPSVYPGMVPPALAHYFRTISRTFEDLPISYSAELWCEPGRALCAEYQSLIVRVEQRRGDQLYINDGAYGTLFDAAHLGWRFPTSGLIEGRIESSEAEQFSFFGPTCDDMDHMAGPFVLPENIAVGDYIEIGQIGAYGSAMRTRFNGFGTHEEVELADDCLLSLYRDDRPVVDSQSNVVQFPGR
jgi:ornithine decarboxylase